MKIHHFGYLTSSIANSVLEFSHLGFNCVDSVIYDELRGINIQFIKSLSGELIELVEPSGNNSVVKGLVSSKGNTIYHICYVVDDIEERINFLVNHGFIVIAPPQPAVAFDNKNVAFLMSKHSGIVELYENVCGK